MESSDIVRHIFDLIIKNKYKILLLLLYVFLFIQMQFIFFYGDDFQVLYPIHRNRNFFNILNYCLDMMNYFWYQWSGRIVGHFTVSFGLSLFGIQFFRILNPIMVFIMIFLSLKILHLFKNFNFEKYLFWLSFIIAGSSIYFLRESLYWAYSGILYIWGFNLTLLVIYLVTKYYLLNNALSKKIFLLISFLCVIQTFILEQLSFLTMSFLILIIIFSIKNKKSYKMSVILLIITIIGFLTSTFAPGNVLRTEPLYVELQGYTLIQIILGKAYCFFAVLFNPEIYGIYIAILFILVSKKYALTIKGKNVWLKGLPLMLAASYITIIFIDKVFNLNVLLFYESHNLDTLQFTHYSISTFAPSITYYVGLIFSLFFMIFNTTYKKNKFLFLSLVVTFICTLIPVICIRYIGTRYYLYFIITIFLAIIYYTCDMNVKKITMADLIGIIAVIFPKYVIIITILILIIYRLCVFKTYRSYKIILYIIIAAEICLILLNIVNIFCGYYRNSKLYRINDRNMINAQQAGEAILYEIPYRDSLYSWHTIFLNFDNRHHHYGFYLNDFYESYYGVNMKTLYIITEDDSYVE